jgi:hypothetical protein
LWDSKAQDVGVEPMRPAASQPSDHIRLVIRDPDARLKQVQV